MYCPISDKSFEKIAKHLYANLEDKVVEFFQDNPNPSDEDLHSWAEDEGYDPHEIEELVYEMATQHVQENSDEDASEDEDPEDDEEIEGGKADGKDPEDYDLDQLLKGIEVEFEHTDDPAVAVEIAMDHLEEIDNYYDDLEDMEDKAKKESKKLAQSGSYEDLVKSLAEEIKKDFAEYGDMSVDEMVIDYIDNSGYVDDYQNCLGILVNSSNASDDGTPIASEDLQFDDQEGWPSLIKQIAKKVMIQDVNWYLDDLGYDGKGFYEPTREDMVDDEDETRGLE